ncbi:MAG: flagellar biosynthesis protein FlhB [Steroidobacteraceae bacterium]
MAGESDRHDKTEDATPKRLEEARERGQIPRSRDLTAAAVMLIAGLGLLGLGEGLGSNLAEVLRSGLTVTAPEMETADGMIVALRQAAFGSLFATAPVLGLTLLAALAAPLALGGWSFSTKALTPDFNRMNPISGFGRMFSLRGWVELVKSLGKFALVAGAATLVLWNNRDALLGLAGEPISLAISHAMKLSGTALLWLTGSLVVIAAIDVPFQLFQYKRDLKMTKEEVRREAKESEGSPEMKGRIRQMQRERAQRRMMQEVPTADVVIVNPTHYAVALRYDEKRNRAPVVVAKGLDHIALKIREVATENGVPLFEAPPLARALHKAVELDQEIPSQLYVAVAQILTYVFQLRTARQQRQSPPVPPVIEFKET